MKTIKPLIISIFIFIIGCSPYKIYNKYEDLKTNNFIEFYLPINILKIDIEIEKTDFIPGELNEYTIEFLGNIPCIQDSSTHYQIKNVKVNVFALPDTNAIYYLVFNKVPKKDNFLIHFYDNGLININNENNTSYKQEKYLIDNEHCKINETQNPFNTFISKQLQEKADTIRQMIMVDSVKRIKTSIQTRLEPKTDYDLAKEISEDIYLLRSYYYDLISGIPEIGYENVTFTIMLNEIKEVYNAYLSYFTGKIIKSPINHSLKVIPSNNPDNEKIFIFSFNKQSGFSYEPSKVNKDNYYLEIIPLKENPSIDNKKINNKSFPARKALPCEIRIINETGNDIIYKEISKIAQKGYVYYLPFDTKK